MAEPLRFGTEFGVSTQNANTQTASSTTRLADGRIVVVWTDAGANAGDVKYQILSPDGQPQGAERTANAGTAGLQGAPRVVGLADGGFVIVWEDFAADANGDIRFRRFDTMGDAFDLADVNATAVTTGYQQDPTIVATASGGFVIGWNEGNTAVTGLGSSTAAMIQERDQFGTVVGPAIRVSGNWGGDYAPQMVYAGASLILAWDDDGGPTTTTNGEDGIYTRTIFGALPTVNFTDGGTRVDAGVFREASRNPDIAYETTLGRLIVWDDVVAGSVGRDVYVDINGLGPVRVNTTTTNDQSNAQVTALAFGGFAVVWQDAGGTLGDIRARVYDSAGVATSADFLVTSAGAATANSQFAPDVVALLDGRFMVTWTDNNDSVGIEGMIFDPRTGPVNWTAPGPGAVWFRGTDFVLGDTITGAGGNDTLDGGSGNDTLVGEAGFDRMIGGLGADLLSGGFDSDIYEVTDTLDTIFEDATEGEFDMVAASVSFVLGAGVHVEGLFVSETLADTTPINLTGNALAQAIFGNGGANTLDGGAGAADTLTGEAGNDSYVIRNAATLIVESASQGSADRVLAAVSFVLAADDNIEVMQTTFAGGLGTINLTGNALSQQIFGNAGTNTLEDGAGAADTLTGSIGNDTYVIRTGSSIIVESGGQGSGDRVFAATSFALAADDSIEVMQTTSFAGTGAINLTGNALAQQITGNAGANVLEDGAGAADALRGAGGNDTYVIRTSGTVIVEGVGEGTADRVSAAVSFGLAGDDNIEILQTTSFAGVGAINLTGNALAQTIIGNAGANALRGAAGNDTLTGGAGADDFIFNTALTPANIDGITDFVAGLDDMLLLTTIFAGIGVGALAANEFHAGASGQALNAATRIIYETDNGNLWYDADGTGGILRVQFGDLAAGLGITAADFAVF